MITIDRLGVQMPGRRDSDGRQLVDALVARLADAIPSGAGAQSDVLRLRIDIAAASDQTGGMLADQIVAEIVRQLG